jgi:hypothetical protein
MLTLLAVAACGDDDPTDLIEGDELTQAEAEALAEVVAGTLFATYGQGALAAPARASGTLEVEDNFPCEFGGSVDVIGDLTFDIDDETGDGTITFDVTQDHIDCGAESEEGIRFVLNGAPDITSTFTIVQDGNLLSFSGGYDGAVGFETEDKEGTCSLDVDFSLQGNVATETGTATLNGRVCGITFSHNLTLT